MITATPKPKRPGEKHLPAPEWNGLLARLFRLRRVAFNSADFYVNDDGQTQAVALIPRPAPTPADELPTATEQYQVVTADANLEWQADWVRAHGDEEEDG